MGCPKHFSISGGMGAALLDKPEVVHDVCAEPLSTKQLLDQDQARL
jgi:tRNA-dihydrouridine synthase